MKALMCAAVLAMSAGAASGEPTTFVEMQRRDRAVSVGLWSLQGLAGLQGQYEALIVNRGWSWIAGGGFRFNAGGDYSSSTLAAGGELRWWISGRAVWATAAPRSMLGWYLGGRLDFSWARTRDAIADRTIGNNLAIALTGTLGYRFLINRRVELTPMIGLGSTRDIDLRGRLPTWRRGTLRLGITAGWMF